MLEEVGREDPGAVRPGVPFGGEEDEAPAGAPRRHVVEEALLAVVPLPAPRGERSAALLPDLDPLGVEEARVGEAALREGLVDEARYRDEVEAESAGRDGGEDRHAAALELPVPDRLGVEGVGQERQEVGRAPRAGIDLLERADRVDRGVRDPPAVAAPQDGVGRPCETGRPSLPRGRRDVGEGTGDELEGAPEGVHRPALAGAPADRLPVGILGRGAPFLVAGEDFGEPLL